MDVTVLLGGDKVASFALIVTFLLRCPESTSLDGQSILRTAALGIVPVPGRTWVVSLEALALPGEVAFLGVISLWEAALVVEAVVAVVVSVADRSV